MRAPTSSKCLAAALVLALVAGFGAGCGADGESPVAPPDPPEEWGVRAWGDATASLRKGEDWSYHYVAQKVKCPICGKEFVAAGLGSYSTREPDLDFKPNGLSADPNLFALWMCPACGYCAFADEFADPQEPEAIRAARKGSRTYDSYFDIPYSALLRAAETCYRARVAFPEWRWAWFHLYGAWVARDSKRPDQERIHHEEARRRFESLADTATDKRRAQAAYLVGEIDRRYGRLEEARAWLDRASKIAAETKNESVLSWIEASRKEMSAGRPSTSPTRVEIHVGR